MSREVFQWSKVAARNIFPFIDGGWREKMLRTTVNDAARENMRAIRNWYDDPEWLDLMRDDDGVAFAVVKQSANVVRITGTIDLTAYFPVGRRVKMTGATPDPVYAHVLSASFSAPNTDVTLQLYVGHTEVPAGGTLRILCHHSSTLGLLAFTNVVQTGLFLPTAGTGAALQAAIDAANAAGGGTVYAYHPLYALTATLQIKSNVFLWGGGWWASGRIRMTNGTNVKPIEFPASTVNAGLIGCSIDANGLNNAGAAVDAVTINDGCSRIEIAQCMIRDARRDGIYLTQSTVALDFIHIQHCAIDLPGRHGVNLDDQLGTSAARILLSSIDVKNPGAYDNDGSGIRCAQQAEIAGVRVELNRAAPALQRGIWLVQKDGANRHARFCSVVGFTIRGSGEQARGVEVGGASCVVSGGTIQLTGSSARGFYFDATTGGQVTNNNVVTGCAIQDCATGVRCEGDSTLQHFAGCQITNCTTGFDIIGDKHSVHGCEFDGGTTHIQLQNGADENDFVGNVHRNGTTHVSVATGTLRNVFTGNHHHDCTTGYSIAGGSTDTVIRDSTFENVTTPISDAGTGTRVYGNHPFLERSYTEKTGGDQSMSTINVLDAITSLSNIAFPGLGANGVRKFLVWPLVIYNSTAGGGPLRIHIGPLGTTADPVAYESVATGSTADMWTPHIEVTPASGDKVTLSTQIAGGGTFTVYGNTTAGKKSLLTIEQVRE